jgi:hypothetical protein
VVADKTILSTAAGVRSECNLPASVSDTMLAPHVISAQIEMKRLLNTEANGDVVAIDQYAAVLAESGTEERSILCTKAENLLAFAYAIPFLNIETSGRGIVSSKGWDGSRSELMSQGQIEQMVANLREQVMNLLSPYLPVEDDDTTDDEELPILNAGGMTMIAI